MEMSAIIIIVIVRSSLFQENGEKHRVVPEGGESTYAGNVNNTHTIYTRGGTTLAIVIRHHTMPCRQQ